eukprot:CAMPEP_0170323214 /NCGR_PEP_ID=MMETSP0116_2-20130129/62402_1 /TAXON_ID=400756 /ORGANISM="Durinskia baltica, Strain CSIRO CS-38" /LENGTH=55 /DNA_ID=CAMNT_0010576107 /DNA_START=84 /DNA_END=247 /DNA_ORIENTATION=-
MSASSPRNKRRSPRGKRSTSFAQCRMIAKAQGSRGVNFPQTWSNNKASQASLEVG